MKKTKSEKREILKKKQKIKNKKGGTLAGQISRLEVVKKYAGHAKLLK
ncbi:MAG TPA: hypothetical protein PKZ16_01135 [bacterium]|nr:hypothetical protein [bacterium]HPL95486.1 hypothetical protein [bacterium]